MTPRAPKARSADGPPRARKRSPDEDVEASLRTASERLAASVRSGGTQPEAVRILLDRLEELSGAVTAEILPSGWAHLPVGEAAALRWLLDELRRELMQEWERLVVPPDAKAMIRVLRYFEAARRELDAHADAQLGRLLASFRGLGLLLDLAHDLRSPLTSILFLSDALHQGRSGALDDVQRRQIGLIYSAALGLSAMANDVIDLVRSQPAPSLRGATSFSIAELLDSIRDLVEPLAETRGIPLRIHLPTLDRRLGEPVALSRVLLNLTTNALKFTEKGFVEVVVRETGGQRLEFSVRDTGRGLVAGEAAQLSADLRLGGPGERADFSGRGLGLTICRKLLALLGSTLQFETRPGEGTRFFFEVELPHV